MTIEGICRSFGIEGDIVACEVINKYDELNQIVKEMI